MKRTNTHLFKHWQLAVVLFSFIIVGVTLFFLIKKDDRETFEEFITNHKYSQRFFENVSDIKKIPKADRPDLAWEQDFLMTMDPSLGYPAKERLLSIFERVHEFKRLKAGIPGDGINNWVERGPDNVAGRVRALMFDPNDVTNKKVWAGSVSGGLWYNNDITDENSDWITVDDFWANLAIGTIAYDPTNTQIFYVGTGEGWYNADAVQGAGIWKSIDGGQNWAQLSSTSIFSFRTTQKIVVTPTGRVIAATSGGVYISDDGGTSWTNKSTGFASDIELAFNGDIYIGKGNSTTSGSLLKSTDGGDSFVDITPTGTTQERVELAVAQSNSSVVYAIASDGNDVSWFKKSIDGGTSWSNIAIPKYLEQSCTLSATDDFTRGQAWYDLILAVHPADEDIVLAGGIDLNKSVDGGVTWSTVSYWTGSCKPYVHADQHAIVFRPSNQDEAIFGSDGGVAYSSDVGYSSTPSFADRNKNLNITQYYAGAMHPDALKHYFLGGCQDNGSHKFESEGVNSAIGVSGGDGAFCFIDQVEPQIQITSYVYNSYYISKDAGKSFYRLQDDDDGSFINPAAYDNNFHILYSAKATNSINRIRTVNIAPEVDYVSISLGTKASSFKVSPYTTESSSVFIGTQSGRLFKLVKGESDSPTYNEIGSSAFPTGYISCIELGASENEILVTFSNYGVTSVWYTVDGGTNWESREGNLPDMPVRWALFNPNNHTEVILATEIGIWSTTNFDNVSPAWTPSSSGLANVRVDMLQMRESDNEVLAVTHGRGMFTSDAFSTIDKNVLNAFISTKGSRYIGIGGTVDFQDLSTGSPTSWSWTFEGGTPATSNEQNPEIVYSAPGDYEISLTVSDGVDNKNITKTSYIHVGQEGGWTIQATAFSNSSRGIDYIDVVDDNVVWALAFDGSNTDNRIKEFTKTVDGGNNWIPNTIDIAGEIYPAMICAYNADTAWIPMYPNSVGAVGGIYITTDGGISWTKQLDAAFTGDDAFANVVHFWNKDEGFCMGDPNGGYFEIYTTTNGGNNWTRVPQANIPAPLTTEYGTVGQFCVAEDGVVFFNTTKGRVYKSKDKGNTWSVITTPLSGRSRIAFADENNGVIVESADNVAATKVYRTVDGGSNWESVSNTNVFTSYIEYVPGTERMYVSSSANTSKAGASFSIDGGNTWERYTEQDGKQCIAVDFYNMTLGWFGQFNATPTEGGILKYTGPATIPGFTISPENVVVEEPVVFTDITLSIELGKAYNWNFGENSDPSVAITEGPHNITYSQKGNKLVTLEVNGMTTSKEFYLSDLGIKSITENLDYIVYPNPNSGEFSLKMNSISQNRKDVYLQLYSLNGLLVYFNKYTNESIIPVNVGKLPSGTYLLKVQTEGLQETRKIIIR